MFPKISGSKRNAISIKIPFNIGYILASDVCEVKERFFEIMDKSKYIIEYFRLLLNYIFLY